MVIVRNHATNFALQSVLGMDRGSVTTHLTHGCVLSDNSREGSSEHCCNGAVPKMLLCMALASFGSAVEKGAINANFRILYRIRKDSFYIIRKAFCDI